MTLNQNSTRIEKKKGLKCFGEWDYDEEESCNGQPDDITKSF